MSNPTSRSLNLDPASLPLGGRHLIEASAGTGKTYNITRLYIRLLVERRLSVQQILVMTFTKAAIEELRGRIATELRRAAHGWGQLADADPFYAALEARVPRALAAPLLRNALLHLDEAAIFTIHGFCARVLKQHALASAMPMELEMEADTTEQALEAVRDWLRSIAHSPAYAPLSERGWHTPEGFWQAFSRAIRSSGELLAADPATFQASGEALKAQVRQDLLSREGEIVSRLIDSHKEAAKRRGEWQTLLDWLALPELCAPPKAAMDFVNGNRYRGQADMQAWLQPFKALKEQLPTLADSAANAAIYPLVQAGIVQIRARFTASKAQLGLMDFDDLITLLAERVTSAAGAGLVSVLRGQYPVALVDEFQDTDPQQYAILERVYLPGGGGGGGEGDPAIPALFMIGDPKQAIYSFRGGDIFTYLSARAGADYCWHMDTNWRSVAAMVRGYNRLFWGAPLAAEAAPVFGYGIGYEPVKATPNASANRAPLNDPPPASAPDSEPKALNYVWLTPAPDDEEAAASVNADFRHQIAAWCSGEIHRLLSTPARLGTQPLQERDIALLVRTGTEAQIMQQALLDAGYASVYLSARDNIFASEEALELQQVLHGILACEESRALIAACATRLLGGDAERLAQLASDADALVTTRYQLLALRERWLGEGFIPMMMALIHDHLRPSPQRHERCLTNHIHLAELLQQASGNLRHPQQLLEWLGDQIRSGGADSQAELRLESDANLIRIVTQHGSKGLEYPVVMVPFANYPKDPLKFGNQGIEYFTYPPPAPAPAAGPVASGLPLQQLGRTPEAEQCAREEGFAEAIRLLYVAVTRAEQRCYLCAAPFKHSALSPLAQTLMRGHNPARDPDQPATGEPDWPLELQQLVASEPGSSALIRVVTADLPGVCRAAPADSAASRRAALFSGQIERDWQLSSFSALTRSAAHSRRDRKDHDDDASAAAEAAPPAERELPLRFRLAKGAHAGNLLHDVLEHTDFSAPRWHESLRDPLLRFGALDEADQPALQQWLQACLESELPPIAGRGGLTLADLSWPRTLREAEFYFPMQGTWLGPLAELLRQHRGAAQLPDLPGYRRLRGMMHGFIDLIFEQEGRFYVADYKSTHLGNRLEDYTSAALQANNEAHYYDLQYLIYALALHRYLGARLEHYDPARHFGGVYYLYLRGMQPGSASGVFATPISTALLESLDQLFRSEQSAPPSASPPEAVP